MGGDRRADVAVCGRKRARDAVESKEDAAINTTAQGWCVSASCSGRTPAIGLTTRRPYSLSLSLSFYPFSFFFPWTLLSCSLFFHVLVDGKCDIPFFFAPNFSFG